MAGQKSNVLNYCNACRLMLVGTKFCFLVNPHKYQIFVSTKKFNSTLRYWRRGVPLLACGEIWFNELRTMMKPHFKGKSTRTNPMYSSCIVAIVLVVGKHFPTVWFVASYNIIVQVSCTMVF